MTSVVYLKTKFKQVLAILIPVTNNIQIQKILHSVSQHYVIFNKRNIYLKFNNIRKY